MHSLAEAGAEFFLFFKSFYIIYVNWTIYR